MRTNFFILFLGLVFSFSKVSPALADIFDENEVVITQQELPQRKVEPTGKVFISAEGVNLYVHRETPGVSMLQKSQFYGGPDSLAVYGKKGDWYVTRSKYYFNLPGSGGGLSLPAIGNPLSFLSGVNIGKLIPFALIILLLIYIGLMVKHRKSGLTTTKRSTYLLFAAALYLLVYGLWGMFSYNIGSLTLWGFIKRPSDDWWVSFISVTIALTIYSIFLGLASGGNIHIRVHHDTSKMGSSFSYGFIIFLGVLLHIQGIINLANLLISAVGGYIFAFVSNLIYDIVVTYADELDNEKYKATTRAKYAHYIFWAYNGVFLSMVIVSLAILLIRGDIAVKNILSGDFLQITQVVWITQAKIHGTVINFYEYFKYACWGGVVFAGAITFAGIAAGIFRMRMAYLYSSLLTICLALGGLIGLYKLLILIPNIVGTLTVSEAGFMYNVLCTAISIFSSTSGTEIPLATAGEANVDVSKGDKESSEKEKK